MCNPQSLVRPCHLYRQATFTARQNRNDATRTMTYPTTMIIGKYWREVNERMSERTPRVVAVLLAAGALASCTSADKRAAADAGIAERAFNQGQMTVARQYVQRALALRDDVSDYWLLLAHIDVNDSDLPGAFEAYENVLTLDRGNVEALTTLCQLGLAGNDPARVDKYADQLALLNPGSSLPPTVKAAAALQRGDNDTAAKMLRQILDKAPGDVGALLVQSRLFAAEGRYADGAALMEQSLRAPGNPTSRLDQMKQLYQKAGDRAGYERTVRRLAEANQTDPKRQLAYADLLYDDGDRDRAYAITRATLLMRPGDVAIASAVLDLWLKQGAGAMSLDQLTRDAGDLDLEGRASLAEYANQIGRPDLALAVLGGGALDGPPTPASSDAKAAAALAVGEQGNRAAALAALNAIIAVDPQQPRALLNRARLESDPVAALSDARRVLADDARNVAARLEVTDLLIKQGDPLLAETTLREALIAPDGDPRVAARLARMLVARGERAEAETMLQEFARANPVSRRAAALATGGAARPATSG